ncbi:MAG: hypothetical protein UW30_C0011G0029 [Candidatus Giovannonibacteria bacterium GW2011_GWA2_44_13b]|uniref:Prepilin-type N-terminal cleavage/methylation domain-containing protein n=1 Tax=Candidatus Giovannonibacteria bacterium GW2011_GWA2_44_13b TaxID=1618647 RepID=A0A0G1H3W0_9BACT|nr:MAG: hypothetical protein UW30_C0011G0029 [Candidatus Giovannonibacteria bacterium GW2011_GWA2_44_13b]
MKLPSTLVNKSLPCVALRSGGFSLVEILVVIAILTALAVMGVIVGLDTYSRQSFNSELNDAVALLQRARSQSINNIGGTPHGVCFDPTKCPDENILFKGADFATRDANFDIKIEKSPAVGYSNSEVVFEQLSGRALACAMPCTVSMSGIRDVNITINYEGRIDY